VSGLDVLFLFHSKLGIQMIRKIVRYQVRKEKIPEVELAIQNFVNSISTEEPQTIYTAYRTQDETIFFHFMAFPSPEAEANHQQAQHTLRFVEALYPNCEILPEFEELSLLVASRPMEIS
jgi:quinol monooxygenase YgiN